MIDLSLIVPTTNRASLLAVALETIRVSTACDYEVIVVDGASTDETPRVLADAGAAFGDRLRILREESREGAVRACNKGTRIARGRYLAFLNDDTSPIPGSLDRALEMATNAGPRVGLLALFHRTRARRSVAYETWLAGVPYRVMHVRGTLYANFPFVRRDLFERLGGFDERFVVHGADPDFSLKAWAAGLEVVPATGCLVDHEEHQDSRRAADGAQAELDNRRLFEKWRLPPANPHANDFDPVHPCTLGART